MRLHATKKFGHVPHEPPEHVRIMLGRFGEVRLEDLHRSPKDERLGTNSMKRKRSLSLLNMNIDMSAVKCLQAYRDVFLKEFGFVCRGREGHFGWKVKDKEYLCRVLGFIEAVPTTFKGRKAELDIVLGHHARRADICADAIVYRKEGFDAEAYEMGRALAFVTLAGAVPGPSKFSLLSEDS